MTTIPAKVEKVFATYPTPARIKIMEIRALILAMAKVENVGKIEETLKWEQPSYLTAPRIGSTIRLGWNEKTPSRISVYFICTTHLVDRFQDIYPSTFNYENGRAIHFSLSDTIPKTQLGHCLAMALTYHRNKK